MKFFIYIYKIGKRELLLILLSILTFTFSDYAIGQVTINKTVVQQNNCNQFNVTLQITGNPNPIPMDIILVIDRSGSMASGSPSSMSHAKIAAINFMRDVFSATNNPGSINRVGIVSYSNYATEDIQLSYASDSNQIISKINSIVANGSTNIADGFYQASKEMTSNARTDCNVIRTIVLLTDGVANMGNTFSAINDRYEGNCSNTPTTSTACTISAYTRGQEAQSYVLGGITYHNLVFTVGLFGGISGATQTVAESTLNFAQNSGFYQTESGADLTGIYSQVFGQLLWAAKAIPGTPMVSDTISNGFSMVPGTLTTSKDTATINGQIISWPLQYINNETITLSYSITADNFNACGLHKSSNSGMKFQDNSCNIVTQSFLNPEVCVPCPEIGPISITQVGCANTIHYNGSLISENGVCNLGQSFYSWEFSINNAIIGSSVGISGDFIIPSQFATETCNSSIKGILKYNSGIGCQINLGEYIFSNLKLQTSLPVLPIDGALTVSCNAEAIAPNLPIVYDICGDLINPVLNSINNSFISTSCAGTVTYSYDYTNCAGLTSNWKFVYTINDTVPPTFSRPADKIIYASSNCSYDASLFNTGDVIDELDNCSSNLEANYSDAVFSGSGQVVFVINRTWSLLDNCNNSAENQIQIITVLDTTPPTIIPPQPKIFCDANIILSNPIVDDNCGISSITSDAPETFLSGQTTIVTWVVTDIHGNTSYSSELVTISNIYATASGSSQLSCHNLNDGTVSVTVNGGTGNYSYSLNGGPIQSSNVFSDLGNGSYIITVYDTNGCSANSNSISISNPDLLESSITGSAQVSCNNLNNGLITVNATGGTGQYSYSINGSQPQSSNLFSSLSAGSYEIRVYDSNNCSSAADTITIINPQPISFILNGTTQVSCHNESDGSIIVIANGGTGVYNYSINGAQLQNSNIFSNLAPGTYIINVFDSNNCVGVATTINIANPLPINFIVNQLPANCGGTQSVIISAHGGTPPYMYSIDGGTTYFGDSLFESLNVSEITIIVKDFNNCISETLLYTIAGIPLLDVNANILSGNKCYGIADAVVSFEATGGNSPYYFYLNNNPPTINNYFSNIASGSNTIIVQDSFGCKKQIDFYIPEQEKIEITIISKTDANCAGKNDGSIEVLASGGQAPYSYQWSNGNTNSLIFNQDAGDYLLIVTDNNGCEEKLNTQILSSEALTEPKFNNSFSPNGDGVNDKWMINNLELYEENELIIINRWGNEILSVKNYQNDWDGSNLSEGTYFYLLKVTMCDSPKTFSGFITILR